MIPIEENGRFFAFSKYYYWTYNPLNWLYETQNFGSIWTEGTNDLIPVLKEMYLDRYDSMTEREQIIDDLNTLLYMLNYNTVRMNSLINSLGSESGTFISSRPDIAGLLAGVGTIIELGATAGLWTLTTVVAGTTVVTMIGSLASGFAAAALIVGSVALVGSFIQGIINKDVAEARFNNTIGYINAFQAEIIKLVGNDYATNSNGKVGGYLKGLLDLAGVTLVKKADGTVVIKNDPTNPNNPKYIPPKRQVILSTNPLTIDTPKETIGTNPLTYIGLGILAVAISKKK